ncbi:cation:dicarboxylate symporter family transporter [Brevibacterium yomogidense]|uniref:cation:dicarboxylate symporter family transporter n=1 Tax=Brevibacterium yomogidense TaxID=946573 RepID=UPI0018E04AE7|nr:cation:dicarboxylase symporter family transporter [Brevibacterium yomogidense]
MKFKLLIWILVAIGVGLILGQFLPSSVLAGTESVRVILSGLLQFFIPLIVFAFIAAGIAELKGRIGKMLSFSVILAYADTVIGISLGVLAAVVVIPNLVDGGRAAQEANPLPDPFFELEIDPPLAVISALILAFVLGLGATWEKSHTLRTLLLEFRDIVLWAIQKIVLPVIPFFILVTFVKLSAEGEIFANIPVFGGMFILLICMQWLWLIIEYSVAGIVARRSPLPMAKAMVPAYLTGMGTMSSAVTMPVALRQAKTVTSIDSRVTDFTIPLFNTVHQACAGIGIAIAAMTVSVITTGELPGAATIVVFILLLAVIEVGAVGIPGGSILASLGILQSVLGFGDPEIGLMLTLFAIQDSFAAAGNVTGDGALTMIVNRFFGSPDEAEATRTKDTTDA